MLEHAHHTVALKYAPVFAHKVSLEWPVADQLAPVDFCGYPLSEGVADNVKRLFGLPADYVIQEPKVYYSVCETSTHVFMIYAVYHVFDWWKRDSANNLYDWGRDLIDEHAHDMEGALMVVRKRPRESVDGLVTVSHRDFFLYTGPMKPKAVGRAVAVKRSCPLRVVKFNETVDGNIWLDKCSGRVKLYVQSRGHGIRGDHKRWGAGDQTWYYVPKGYKGDPGKLGKERDNSEVTKKIVYELEDITAPKGIWEQRFNPAVFRQKKNGQWGFVCRKKLTTGTNIASKANPPWSWNDHNDTSPIGEIATDPARFITRYAQGWGPVSQCYVWNPYFAINGNYLNTIMNARTR